jgi:hypothetical protein
MINVRKEETGFKLSALSSLYPKEKLILYSQYAKIYQSHQTFSFR